MTEDAWLVLDEYEPNQFQLIAVYASRAAAMEKARELYPKCGGTIHVRFSPAPLIQGMQYTKGAVPAANIRTPPIQSPSETAAQRAGAEYSIKPPRQYDRNASRQFSE